VCEGPPETVAKCAASHTGRFLAPMLGVKASQSKKQAVKKQAVKKPAVARTKKA
jgi:hypothetical protein